MSVGPVANTQCFHDRQVGLRLEHELEIGQVAGSVRERGEVHDLHLFVGQLPVRHA
jgi:hypothetical protein